MQPVETNMVHGIRPARWALIEQMVRFQVPQWLREVLRSRRPLHLFETGVNVIGRHSLDVLPFLTKIRNAH
jgi:hypothetical protein